MRRKARLERGDGRQGRRVAAAVAGQLAHVPGERCEREHREAGRHGARSGENCPEQQAPGHRQPRHDVDLHLRILGLRIEVQDLPGAERPQEDHGNGAQAGIAAARPQDGDAGDEDRELQQHRDDQRDGSTLGRQRVDPAADDEKIVADAGQHHPGLVP